MDDRLRRVGVLSERRADLGRGELVVFVDLEIDDESLRDALDVSQAVGVDPFCGVVIASRAQRGHYCWVVVWVEGLLT